MFFLLCVTFALASPILHSDVTVVDAPDEPMVIFSRSVADPHPSLLPLESLNYLADVECSTGTEVILVFDQELPLPVVAPGRIVAGGATYKCDSKDLLRKVVSVRQEANRLVLSTVDAAIGDAFKSVDLEMFMVRESSLASLRANGPVTETARLLGERLAGSANAEWVDKTWTVWTKYLNYNTATGKASQEISIAGGKKASINYWLTCTDCWAKFRADIYLKLTTSFLSLETFTLRFDGTADSKLLFEAGLRYQGSWGPYERVLHTWSLLSPLPSIKIGPVSFTVGPAIELGAGCKASMNAVATLTWGATAGIDLSVGLAYTKSSGWRTIWTPSTSFRTIAPTLTYNVDVRTEGWLYLKPKLTLGDVVMAYAVVKPKLALTGKFGTSTSQCPARQLYYQLDYGVDASFGYRADVDISVLHWHDSHEWPRTGPWNRLTSGCIALKAAALPDEAPRIEEEHYPEERAVYVDAVAGADLETVAGDREHPFRTLSYAISRLASSPASARVVLLPGTHSQRHEVVVPPGLPLTIASLTGLSSLAGSAADTILDCGFETRALLAGRATNLTLRGVTLQHCQSNSGAGGAINLLPGAHFEAYHSRFWDNTCTGSVIMEGRDKLVTPSYGGAIAGHEADITLFACTFEENTASIGGALSSCGHGAHLVVEECLFQENIAEVGGAAHVAAARATLRTNEFSGNVAFLGSRASGGALYITNLFEPRSMAVVESCTFHENRAQVGGAVAVMIHEDGQVPREEGVTPVSPPIERFAVVLTGCDFERNFAQGLFDALDRKCGGALAVQASGASLGPDTLAQMGAVTVDSCRFEANQAQMLGGAICADRVQTTVINSELTNNRALVTDFNGTLHLSRGGAIFCRACALDLVQPYVSGNSYSRYLSGQFIESVACEASAHCRPCDIASLCSRCDYDEVNPLASPTEPAPVVPLVCEDGNPYTTKSCEDEAGCVFRPLYSAPRIDGIEPALGPTAGGFPLTLWGEALAHGDPEDVAAVVVGNVPCTGVALTEAGALVCRVAEAPAGASWPAGPADIQLISRKGGPASSYARFLFEAPSEVASLVDLHVSVGQLKPHFDPRILDYSLDLDGSLDEFTLTAIPEVSAASVNMDGRALTASQQWARLVALRPGTTTVLLRVTAADEVNSLEYKVTVTLPESAGPALGVGPAVAIAAVGGCVGGAAIALALVALVTRARRRRRPQPSDASDLTMPLADAPQ